MSDRKTKRRKEGKRPNPVPLPMDDYDDVHVTIVEASTKKRRIRFQTQALLPGVFPLLVGIAGSVALTWIGGGAALATASMFIGAWAGFWPRE